MSEHHWRNEFKSNFLGSHLMDNQDKILTIARVTVEDLMTTDGSKKRSLVAHFQEAGVLPMVLNKTNCRQIAKLYHENDYTKWTGKKLQVYVDHNVKAFGDTVDGLRIRNKIPQDVKIACVECGQMLKPGFNMDIAQLAAYTKNKYGRCLCVECAQEIAKGKKAPKAEKPADPESAPAADTVDNRDQI